MLIKHHSDSGDAQLTTNELCNHYESSIYTQTHAQDIHTSLMKLCITTWKGIFQSFFNHWESQWVLVDKSTPLRDQESPAVHKSMLCNSICSNLTKNDAQHTFKVPC